ncbi:MAG: LPXTG cell wall anchor domain-containing protein [Actinomycetia bacterium]|nr:LPXTG cell wall anchor domain-containing protein [Actinomycetes bacterium]
MLNLKGLIVTMLGAVIMASAAIAPAATTDLPPGVLIGDSAGISVGADGDYFIDAEDLHAGDVITKQLTILNTEASAYDISLAAEPLDETGPLKLLDEVRCTLVLDGAVIYDGRVRGADGTNMIVNALSLGNYTSGQQRTLDITLTVNPQMKTHSYSASTAFFSWKFYATKKTPSPPISALPKTGDIVRYALYLIILMAALIAGISLALMRERRKSLSHKC